MRDLLVSIGEILIDFLPVQEGGRTTGFSMHAGGATLNVAVGMGRLGRRSAFAGKISGDLFGRYLRGCIEQEGLDTRFLVPSDAPSTLAFVAMEDGEPAYAFYGEGAADTLLTFDEMPEALFEEIAIIHFGSISLLRGTTPAAVLAIVERLKGQSLLSFDPNLRPGLVRDEAAYRRMLNRCYALADVVKLSAADLVWLAPNRSVEEYAEEVAGKGACLVVVTRGGKGVLAVRGSERWEVPGFSVPVADTVGAGDSFGAGLLSGLSERGVTSRAALAALPSPDLETALRFAAAVSAITCTRTGADPPGGTRSLRSLTR